MQFIQLGRAGDIINLLPLLKHLHDEGNEIEVITNHEFANVLDGVSYATAIAVDQHPHQIDEVLKRYPDAIRSQVFLHPDNPNLTISESFAIMQWRFVAEKYVHYYHILPLVFDRRNKDREQKLIERLAIDPAKPVIAYNFESHSSPFPHKKCVLDVLATYDANIINLNAFRCERIYDQLAILEQTDILLTVDTATLHLANAVKKPTIAFSYAASFLASPKREFWVSHQRYNSFDLAEIKKHIDLAIAINSVWI